VPSSPWYDAKGAAAAGGGVGRGKGAGGGGGGAEMTRAGEGAGTDGAVAATGAICGIFAVVATGAGGGG
jgi:hypothetical protein